MSLTTMSDSSMTLAAVRAGNLTVRDIDTEFIDAVPEDPLEYEERNKSMPANAEYSKGGVEHTHGDGFSKPKGNLGKRNNSVKY
jgi:hypothetical protein